MDDNSQLTTFPLFLPEGWSISLFHYRNHGHDFGRVLVGLVVEDKDRMAFSLFLENLGYQHTNETDNISYLQFLK